MISGKGSFVISLDFELHWGGFEKWPVAQYKQYFANTRKVIPEMLKMFSDYDVHVTWATVGMLFHRDREALVRNFPDKKPSYAVKELSAYDYIQHEGIGKAETDDPLHYADTLIKQILETPNQELASHTFAHYYCNEPGQTLEQFRDDLKSAQKAASEYGQKLTSLVFPRNQFNDQYLKVCFEEGITAVRDNPKDWFWKIESTQSESLWKRLNRGLDAYMNVGGKTTFPLKAIAKQSDFPCCIPASRLLRPYNPSELFLNSLKLKRIAAEMKAAALSNEVYHLWWHPHNFGNYPKESLIGLQNILRSFDRCRTEFNMRTLTMKELSDNII